MLSSIQEFIVISWTSNFDAPASLEFQKVHIKPHQFIMSSTLINQYLHRNTPKNVNEQHLSLKDLVFELISDAGSSWPKMGQLSTTMLSVKYAFCQRLESQIGAPYQVSLVFLSL